MFPSESFAQAFFAGPNADWLAMLPFIVLSGFLYLVGREALLAGKKRGT